MENILRNLFGDHFLKPASETISNGLQVMLYGLAGVFTVLILFFIMTKLLMLFSRTKLPSQKEN